MRIAEAGRAPRLEEIEEPPGEGDVLADVDAFSLNPIDVNVSLGRFYGGTPPLPYVAGVEAVGRDEHGRRVYLNGPGIGIARNGVWAERVRVPASAAHEVPAGASDEVALASGVAGLAGWIPVTWRTKVGSEDRVLVLGATGSVGRVAVQAAKVRGAARVVGAGRRPEALDGLRALGADAVVQLEGDLESRFRDAFDGDGPTVVIDALWGEPLVAALAAAVPGARIVNLGQSAGAEATIASGTVRGKQLELYGYSNYAVPPKVFERSYRELVEHAVAGRVRFDDVDTYPVERLREAWERQVAGAGAKLVVRF
ncbi:MAG: zinc-binding alcohol dehydrogenase family protein [Acidobacteriota bacterium]